LYCQRSLAAGQSAAESPTGADGFSARLKMMPCSSKAEAWRLLQILADGASGVELVCCPQRACQFLDGNDRAEKRVRRAQSLLEEIDESPERLGLSRGSGLTEDDLVAQAKNRAEAIEALDSNLTEKVKEA
jgi:coenzyme F420-reducing hydrogenase delta subunit